MDLYLAESKYTYRTSTVNRNTDALNSVLSIIGEDCLMHKLTAVYVREKLLMSGKKPGTLNNYMIRFKTFVKWAYRHDYLDSTALIDKFEPFHEETTARERIKDKFMDSEELQKLLDGIQHEENRLIIEFLALSGLRVGELSALEDKDVDDEWIHVTKTWNPVSEELTSGKTLAAARDVHIQPELKDCIRRLRKSMKTRKMAAGVPRSKLFVISIEGTRLGYYAINKFLKKVTKEIIGRTLTVHSLRHTHASLLAARGYPLEAISRRLGHEDSRITKEIYLHTTRDIQKADADLLDKITLLPPSCPQNGKKVAETL